MDKVFPKLVTIESGLSIAKAEKQLAAFGPNKLHKKKESEIFKSLGFMWNPLLWVMEIAAIMAIVLANNWPNMKHSDFLDYQDFVGIITLFLINSTIGFIEEDKAGNVAAALMACLAPIIAFLLLLSKHSYINSIDNLLVLLIGGISIAMPTVLSVTMAIGAHRLSTQGAITKRMTAIKEMVGMDILYSDKTNTLTFNKLIVDKALMEVFSPDMDAQVFILLAACASRIENQDAINLTIIGTLDNPRQAHEGIQEVHFLPFNPTNKQTTITYIDQRDN